MQKESIYKEFGLRIHSFGIIIQNVNSLPLYVMIRNLIAIDNCDREKSGILLLKGIPDKQKNKNTAPSITRMFFHKQHTVYQ